MTNLNRLTTINDIALVLNVSPHTVRRAYKSGKLKGYKIGRLIRFTQEDVKDWCGIHVPPKISEVYKIQRRKKNENI